MKKTTGRRCRACGCTDEDCRECIARTGQPCSWVAEDLCSACLRAGYNTVIRVRTTGSDNIATVRVGGRTLRRSCTESGRRAAERLAEKAAAAAGATESHIVMYRSLSVSAAKAALHLEFRNRGAA